MGLSLRAVHYQVRGELVNSPHIQIRLLDLVKGIWGILNVLISLKHLEDFILQKSKPKSLRNSLELRVRQNSRKGLGWRIEWILFIKLNN